MDKFRIVPGTIGISTLLGVAVNAFNAEFIPYLILFLMIIIDTGTGIAKSIKYNRFSSKGLKKFIKKVLLYATSILTMKLFEFGMASVFKTDIFSQIIAMFLIITETVSILENLTLLGVPIPTNFVKFLLGQVKLPGIGKIDEASVNSIVQAEELDEIIKYQLPTFKNPQIKKLLDIKLKAMKSIIDNINTVITHGKCENNELLYYEIMAIIEIGLKDLDSQLKEADISKDILERFREGHQSRIKRWLAKVKEICFSSECDGENKKQKIIESTLILMHQSMIAALKLE